MVMLKKRVLRTVNHYSNARHPCEYFQYYCYVHLAKTIGPPKLERTYYHQRSSLIQWLKKSLSCMMNFTNPKPHFANHDKNQEHKMLGISLFHHPVVLSIHPVLTPNDASHQSQTAKQISRKHFPICAVCSSDLWVENGKKSKERGTLRSYPTASSRIFLAHPRRQYLI